MFFVVILINLLFILISKAARNTTKTVLQEKWLQDVYLNRSLASKNCVADCTSAITWLDRMDSIVLLRTRFLFVPYRKRTSNSKSQHYYPKAVLCNFDSPGKPDVDIKERTKHRALEAYGNGGWRESLTFHKEVVATRRNSNQTELSAREEREGCFAINTSLQSTKHTYTGGPASAL
jgi:hypothetical protein